MADTTPKSLLTNGIRSRVPDRACVSVWRVVSAVALAVILSSMLTISGPRPEASAGFPGAPDIGPREISTPPHSATPSTPTGAAWTNLTASPNPGPRQGYSMTYDGADRDVVLFGGQSSSGRLLDDTWTYHAGVWANVTSTAGTPPPARSATNLVYDAADSYLLLAGGVAGAAGQLSDVWKFSGGNWTELSSAGLPRALQDVCGVQTAYDSTDSVVIFLAASCFSDATGGVAYSYRSGTWTDLSLNQSTNKSIPTPGFEGGALVADPALGGVVFYGGTDLYGKSAYNETYVYSNGTFVDQTANLTGSPPGEVYPSAAYDSSAGGALLFGGLTYSSGNLVSSNLTWLLGANGWTNLTTGPSPPASTGGGQLAWDTYDNETVWYGESTNSTWGWGSTPPLAGVTILASPPIAEVGRPVQFSGTGLGGVPPFSYNWSFGDGGASSAASPSHAFNSIGSYTVQLALRDAANHSARASLPLSVVTGLSCSASASSSATDVGTEVTFTAANSGGAGTVTDAWSFGDGSNNVGSPVSHAFATPGTFLVNLSASDTAGGTSQCRLSIVVNPSLALSAISVSDPLPDLGEVVNFSVAVSGGTAPYALSWAFGDGSVGGNLDHISHIFTTNGPFTVTARADDGAGRQAESTFNVTIALNVSVLANWTAGAAPLPIGFSALTVGGAPEFAYSWTFGDGTGSQGASPSHIYEAAGYYVAQLRVSDGRGQTAIAAWSVYVGSGGGAPLALYLSAGPSSSGLGSAALVSASVSGGFGGYTLVWSTVGLGCSPAGFVSERCTTATAGVYKVGLTVTDQDGHQAEAFTSVTFTPTTGGRSAAGPLLAWNSPFVLGSLLVVGACTLAVLAFGRRLRGNGPEDSGGFSQFREAALSIGVGRSPQRSDKSGEPRRSGDSSRSTNDGDQPDPLSDLT